MTHALKLFTCLDHGQHYPVGSCSIVVAENEAAARVLLNQQLIEHGLQPDVNYSGDQPYTLQEVDLNQAQAIVLNDGNY